MSKKEPTKRRPAPAEGPAVEPVEPPRGVVPMHWEFFQLGRSVHEAARTQGVGKKRAARGIDEQTGCGYDRARKAASFYERYRRQRDLSRLGRIRTRDGRPLTETHLHRLGLVGDPALREELMAGLEREGWTSEELSRRIRRHRGGEALPGGRKFRVPDTLTALVDQVAERSADWLKAHDAAWNGDLSGLSRQDAAEPSEQAERLHEAIELVRNLRITSEELEERLRQLRTRLKRKGRSL